MFTKEADAAMQAGFMLAINTSSATYPHTEREFFQKNTSQVISVLDPENKKL
jgi:hypothetical protein